MHFNISGISPPNFTPPKDRKQSFNICSKKYNEIFVLCLLAVFLLWWPKRELMNLMHST